jgi:hypothetical protein
MLLIGVLSNSYFENNVESNEIPLLAKDLQSYAIAEAVCRLTINNGSQSNFHYDGIIFKV